MRKRKFVIKSTAKKPLGLSPIFQREPPKKAGKLCSSCLLEIEVLASICPHCRQFQDWKRHIPAITFISIFLGVVGAFFGIIYPLYKNTETFFSLNRPALSVYSGDFFTLKEGKLEFTIQNDGDGVALFSPTILCKGKVIEENDSVGKFTKPNLQELRMPVIFQADGTGVVSAGTGNKLTYSMYMSFTKQDVLLELYRNMLFRARSFTFFNLNDDQVKQLEKGLLRVKQHMEERINDAFSSNDLNKNKLEFWQNYSNKGTWNCELMATDVDGGLFWEEKFELVILASDAARLEETTLIPYGFKISENEQLMNRMVNIIKSMENRQKVDLPN